MYTTPAPARFGPAAIGAPMPMSARPSPLKSPPVTENPSSSPPWPVIVNDAAPTSSEAGAETPGPRNT